MISLFINRVSFFCVLLSLLFVCFSYTSVSAQLTGISSDSQNQSGDGFRYFLIQPSNKASVQFKIYIGDSATASPATYVSTDWIDASVSDGAFGVNVTGDFVGNTGKFLCVTARESDTNSNEVSGCATPAIIHSDIPEDPQTQTPTSKVDGSAPNFIRIEDISASRSDVTFSIVVEHDGTDDNTGEAETFSIKPLLDEESCSTITTSDEYTIDTSVTGEQTIEVTITGLSRGTSYDCDITLLDDADNNSNSKKLTFRTSSGGGGGGGGSIGSSVNINAPTFGDEVDTSDDSRRFCNNRRNTTSSYNRV